MNKIIRIIILLFILLVVSSCIKQNDLSSSFNLKTLSYSQNSNKVIHETLQRSYERNEISGYYHEGSFIIIKININDPNLNTIKKALDSIGLSDFFDSKKRNWRQLQTNNGINLFSRSLAVEKIIKDYQNGKFNNDDELYFASIDATGDYDYEAYLRDNNLYISC